MSQIGTLSQYALAVQEAQIAIIRNNAEMQQNTIEVLLESSEDLTISSSSNRGYYVDVSI
ncbi:MAG: hypothetical protein PHE89_03190 [Alphaproteobacteria bacterium]|nr:hypothetical protein [Alphaproteobacteria bacterium]